MPPFLYQFCSRKCCAGFHLSKVSKWWQMRADLLSLFHQEVQFVYPGLESGLWATNVPEVMALRGTWRGRQLPRPPCQAGSWSLRRHLRSPPTLLKRPHVREPRKQPTRRSEAPTHVPSQVFRPRPGHSSHPRGPEDSVLDVLSPAYITWSRDNPIRSPGRGSQNCVQNKMQFRSSMFSCHYTTVEDWRKGLNKEFEDHSSE